MQSLSSSHLHCVRPIPLRSARSCSKPVIVSPDRHCGPSRGSPLASTSGRDGGNESKYGLLVECDGVLVHAHDAHRLAFNEAFKKLNFEFISWTPEMYFDLLRSSDGSGESLIGAYFQTVGWPRVLPSSSRSRRAFAEEVHSTKRTLLKAMVNAGAVPLRHGVRELIDEALQDGVKIGVISSTVSSPDESLVSSAMLQLGPMKAWAMKVFVAGGDGLPEPPTIAESEAQADAAQDGTDLQQQISLAQTQLKKTAGVAFVEATNTRGPGTMLDPAMVNAVYRSGLVSAEMLRNVASTLDVDMRNTAFLCANLSTMKAARSANMLAAAVQSTFARGAYRATADAIFDGFGPGGGATWRRLRSLLDARNGTQ